MGEEAPACSGPLPYPTAQMKPPPCERKQESQSAHLHTPCMMPWIHTGVYRIYNGSMRVREKRTVAARGLNYFAEKLDGYGLHRRYRMQGDSGCRRQPHPQSCRR